MIISYFLKNGYVIESDVLHVHGARQLNRMFGEDLL